MTAEEHLRFYARARGVANVEHNVDQVLHAVGMAPFKSRLAAKLSGGNKRKLSLGIALMGDPSVLLLDEPSSGMDAASKRVMWRTLSSVSSGRSLVLTTHVSVLYNLWFLCLETDSFWIVYGRSRRSR